MAEATDDEWGIELHAPSDEEGADIEWDDDDERQEVVDRLVIRAYAHMNNAYTDLEILNMLPGERLLPDYREAQEAGLRLLGNQTAVFDLARILSAGRARQLRRMERKGTTLPESLPLPQINSDTESVIADHARVASSFRAMSWKEYEGWAVGSGLPHPPIPMDERPRSRSRSRRHRSRTDADTLQPTISRQSSRGSRGSSDSKPGSQKGASTPKRARSRDDSGCRKRRDARERTVRHGALSRPRLTTEERAVERMSRRELAQLAAQATGEKVATTEGLARIPRVPESPPPKVASKVVVPRRTKRQSKQVIAFGTAVPQRRSDRSPRGSPAKKAPRPMPTATISRRPPSPEARLVENVLATPSVARPAGAASTLTTPAAAESQHSPPPSTSPLVLPTPTVTTQDAPMPTALIPETTATTTTQDSDAVLPATTRHSPEAKPPHEPLEGRTLGEPVVRRALGVIPAMAHLALGAVVCCLSFATSTTASFTDTLAGTGPRFTRRPITSQARVRSGSEAERAEQRLRDALNRSQNEPSPKRSRSPSLPRLVQRTATVAVKQLVRATGASFLGASADTLTVPSSDTRRRSPRRKPTLSTTTTSSTLSEAPTTAPEPAAVPQATSEVKAVPAAADPQLDTRRRSPRRKPTSTPRTSTLSDALTVAPEPVAVPPASSGAKMVLAAADLVGEPGAIQGELTELPQAPAQLAVLETAQKVVVSPVARPNYLPVKEHLVGLGTRRLTALRDYRRPYTIAQVELALQKDENGGYRSLTSKQDCQDPLGIRPLHVPLVMGRDRPARRKLFGGERANDDSWKEIWLDSLTTWELDRGDFEVLAMQEGCAQTLGVGERGVTDDTGSKVQFQILNTVHSACGHITTGPDFHAYCRACQILSTGGLCCSARRGLCKAGIKYYEDKNSNPSFLAVSKSRTAFVRDTCRSGRRIRLRWFGAEWITEKSHIARLAFAEGLGYTKLAAARERYVAMSTHSNTVRKLANLVKQGAVELVKANKPWPARLVDVIPAYLLTKAPYMKLMKGLYGPPPTAQKLQEELNKEDISQEESSATESQESQEDVEIVGTSPRLEERSLQGSTPTLVGSYLAPSTTESPAVPSLAWPAGAASTLTTPAKMGPQHDVIPGVDTSFFAPVSPTTQMFDPNMFLRRSPAPSASDPDLPAVNLSVTSGPSESQHGDSALLEQDVPSPSVPVSTPLTTRQDTSLVQPVTSVTTVVTQYEEPVYVTVPSTVTATAGGVSRARKPLVLKILRPRRPATSAAARTPVTSRSVLAGLLRMETTRSFADHAAQQQGERQAPAVQMTASASRPRVSAVKQEPMPPRRLSVQDIQEQMATGEITSVVPISREGVAGAPLFLGLPQGVSTPLAREKAPVTTPRQEGPSPVQTQSMTSLPSLTPHCEQLSGSGDPQVTLQDVTEESTLVAATTTDSSAPKQEDTHTAASTGVHDVVMPTGADALDDAVIREALDDWQRVDREEELKEQFNLPGAQFMTQQPQLELQMEQRASYTPYSSSNTPGSNLQMDANQPQTPREDTYVFMVHAGRAGPYARSVQDQRLGLYLDDKAPIRISDGLTERAVPRDAPDVIPLHAELLRTARASEQRRQRGFTRHPNSWPETTTWLTDARMAASYLDESHAVPVRPPPLAAIRPDHTADCVEPSTVLPITYSAMHAQEEWARLNFHDQSLSRHALDNMWALLQPVLDGGTLDDAGRQRLRNAKEDLDDAMTRAANSSTESMMAAGYHRRQALLHGTDDATIRQALLEPIASATNASGFTPAMEAAFLAASQQAAPQGTQASQQPETCEILLPSQTSPRLASVNQTLLREPSDLAGVIGFDFDENVMRYNYLVCKTSTVVPDAELASGQHPEAGAIC